MYTHSAGGGESMSCHQIGYDSGISSITIAVACTGLPVTRPPVIGMGSTRAEGAERSDEDEIVSYGLPNYAIPIRPYAE
ncbi:hypothetical protein GCM10007269_11820 [Microbacterium murale]|uniref:Uncharacterized protein n=1 Tax=Microbacterium murale TaxID=1081040 RepID=A0ABQ1RL32_9MICO|nr:hypothetical protein GCM10007269_11820 [Microbacterium murale]